MNRLSIRVHKARTILVLITLLAICSFFVSKGLWQQAIVIGFLFMCLTPSSIEVRWKNGSFICEMLLVLLSSATTFLMVQLAINASVHAVGLYKICLNLLIITAFTLVFAALSGRIRFSALACALLFLVYASIDFYVFRFRGREITPFDILSFRTAANVAAEFNFSPDLTLISAWFMFFQLLAVSFSFPKWKLLGAKSRLVAFLLSVGCIVGVQFGSQSCIPRHFDLAGAGINGSVLNFVLSLDGLRNDPPEGYSIEKVSEIESQVQTQINSLQKQDHKPDIIVIMDESFADLNVLGPQFRTNYEVTPFINSLRENTVRGYALSSVYGGDTANSEYEFLTGNSMFFLPESTVPYQQYIKNETYSIVSYLKGQGYTTLAMHPYNSSGWMRTTVYPLLGFDSFVFIEDFPQKEYVRNFISDNEMFHELEKRYKQITNTDEPVFIFGVTMQNHGGYDYTGSDFDTSITLEGFQSDYPEAEQYLSLIYETDCAVKELIEFYQKVDREVVVVFFGDHLPGLSMSFYQEIHGGEFRTLDEDMLRYKVPFFIWANYDIAEEDVSCTSINYLTALMFNSCGMKVPHFQQFLLNTIDSVPAINSRGYYSIEANSFIAKEKKGFEHDFKRRKAGSFKLCYSSVQ